MKYKFTPSPPENPSDLKMLFLKELLDGYDHQNISAEILEAHDLKEKVASLVSLEEGWFYGQGVPARKESLIGLLNFLKRVAKFETVKFITLSEFGHFTLLLDLWPLGELETNYDNDQAELYFLAEDKVRLFLDIKGVSTEKPTAYSINETLKTLAHILTLR